MRNIIFIFDFIFKKLICNNIFYFNRLDENKIYLKELITLKVIINNLKFKK